MRAVVVDPLSAVGVSLGQRAEPVPAPDQALVRVAEISLNPGELRSRDLLNSPGWMPGRDFAGVVIRSAEDGSGPHLGTRVFGLVNGGAFAELVAVRSRDVAPVPSSVSLTHAAALPVAGLTAFLALDRAVSLRDCKVLVTGASGGVGHLGVQLARAAGASVTGAIRDRTRGAAVEAVGADRVLASGDLADGFDFALDTVGGETLAGALRMLRPEGRCITIGSLGGETTKLDLADFLVRGLTLEGLYLWRELGRSPAAESLQRLMGYLESGEVRPQIGAEGPWTEIESLAQRLLRREVTGKVVLHVDW
jgi:NADPH:quinone reductase-like Zn-dependent oxidoreductase